MPCKIGRESVRDVMVTVHSGPKALVFFKEKYKKKTIFQMDPLFYCLKCTYLVSCMYERNQLVYRKYS